MSTQAVEKLLDAAFRQLQHDTGPSDPEWVFQRKVLGDEFRKILTIAPMLAAQPAKCSPGVFDDEINRLNEKLYGSRRTEFIGNPDAQGYCLGAYDALVAARARFNAAQPVAQTGVPEGYALVPINATDDEIDQACEAMPDSELGRSLRAAFRVIFRRVLRKLAAAPTPKESTDEN